MPERMRGPGGMDGDQEDEEQQDEEEMVGGADATPEPGAGAPTPSEPEEEEAAEEDAGGAPPAQGPEPQPTPGAGEPAPEDDMQEQEEQQEPAPEDAAEEEQEEQTQTFEAEGPGQGVEEFGREPRFREAAQEVEQQFLEERPEFDEEDVAVFFEERDGETRAQIRLTESGAAFNIAEQLRDMDRVPESAVQEGDGEVTVDLGEVNPTAGEVFSFAGQERTAPDVDVNVGEGAGGVKQEEVEVTEPGPGVPREAETISPGGAPGGGRLEAVEQGDLSEAVAGFETATGIDIPGEGPLIETKPRGEQFGSEGRIERGIRDFQSSTADFIETVYTADTESPLFAPGTLPEDEQEAAGETAASIASGAALLPTQIPLTAIEAGELGREAVEGEVTLEELETAAATKAVRTGEAVASDPIRFTGSAVGSVVVSGGLIGGATKLAGPATGRAVSIGIQPGEELAIAAARTGIVPSQAARAVPGVRKGHIEADSSVTSGLSESISAELGRFRRAERGQAELTNLGGESKVEIADQEAVAELGEAEAQTQQISQAAFEASARGTGPTSVSRKGARAGLTESGEFVGSFTRRSDPAFGGSGKFSLTRGERDFGPAVERMRQAQRAEVELDTQFESVFQLAEPAPLVDEIAGAKARAKAAQEFSVDVAAATEMQVKPEVAQEPLAKTEAGTEALADVRADVDTRVELRQEPLLEPVSEPMLEPVTEPTGEPTGEPMKEPRQEPPGEPFVEPPFEPRAEPQIEAELDTPKPQEKRRRRGDIDTGLFQNIPDDVDKALEGLDDL